jgi:hypothetical protein
MYQCHTRTQNVPSYMLEPRGSTVLRNGSLSAKEIVRYLHKYNIRIRQMYVHCTVVTVQYGRALVRSVDIFQTLDQSAGFLSDEWTEYAEPVLLNVYGA